MGQYNSGATNHTFDAEIRVDSIKNNAGTGAPDFPNGLTTNGNEVTSKPTSEIYLSGANGTGGSSSGDTSVRNFSTTVSSVGSAITYNARTATTGDSFTINEDGIYAAVYSDRSGAGTTEIALTLNSTGTSSAPSSLSAGELLGFSNAAAGLFDSSTVTFRASASDVIRCQFNPANAVDGTGARVFFRITQVAKT